MEGRYLEAAVPDERFQIWVAGDRRLEWDVEADEEDATSRFRQATSLLDGEDGLAAPGRSNDGRPWFAPQDVEDVELVLRRPDDRPLTCLEIDGEDGPKGGRRTQDGVDDRQLLLAQRPVAGTVA